MVCNTCDQEDKQVEVLAVLAFAAEQLKDIAPCVTAIVSGVALKFKAGDAVWLYEAATAMSTAGLQAVKEMENPARQILTGANVATD